VLDCTIRYGGLINNLAFSNTIEGIIHDANYVDGSLYGIGRAPAIAASNY